MSKLALIAAVALDFAGRGAAAGEELGDRDARVGRLWLFCDVFGHFFAACWLVVLLVAGAPDALRGTEALSSARCRKTSSQTLTIDDDEACCALRCQNSR